MRLADLSWPETKARAAAGALLAIPLGATEQHGPHLPLATDTDVAVALCERLAAVRDDVLIAPPVPYGSSGEHAGFAGTLSIGQQATETLIVELGRSAAETFDRLLFVSAHGGNAEPVTRAVRQLRAEGRDTLLYTPRWAGEPHAGAAETSMMLVLRPQTVAMERAVAGDLRPLAEILPDLRRGGVLAVSPTGVLGDPTGATEESGRALLDRLTADLLTRTAQWAPRPTS
ncbi:creatininase [Actinoplanes sp. SE50]|uniref:mycofactocin biosynthesis peptidyl-dipeptidase MftE n=1 Tax=unclassified Actinoplanes TaxID=2626549 RepID=UPI00023EBFA4|nr:MULTISPECIES: mycofactocin biosynthesis peptidyl-dipeptidase MftE [unclassified Actinoplanes]AEV86930.1 hypothetical protein ACPL_6043 [Actinoplanes sp. SE50/110]ATO85326.1 creatininase [Actinoplanes sp. SE50]SLM02737.1 mycofactocin system creatininase family protein [Actinoplanes sp. SE50/110]